MKLLAPIGYLYGRVMDMRNAMYNRGILRSYPLGARTISVGNLTTGGTGKTPLVAQVGEMLAESGEKVCVLTRGYGRKNAKDRVLVSDGEKILADAAVGGDEPVELARRLHGKAVVVADANRIAAAKWAREKFGITAFVLDDGFQHRRAKRDLDVVCIDAANPYGNGRILPAGPLREPFENLERANAIVITRTAQVRDLDDLRVRISKTNPRAPIFCSYDLITRIVSLGEFHAKTQSPQRISDSAIRWLKLKTENRPNVDQKTRISAFCALGNPDNFFRQLESEFDKDGTDGFSLSMVKKFPDHHVYTQRDIDLLEREARKRGIDAFLTTAKDAVKLSGMKFELKCYVVEIRPVIDNDAEFRKLITSF